MGGGQDYDGNGYDEEPRRYQNTRVRRRQADEPDYVEETTFIERGKGRPPPEARQLVYRGRGREDSVEDIERDFSPPSGARRPRGYGDYGKTPQRARSQQGRRNDDYSDDDYSDGAVAGAGGAAAGYAAGRAGRGRGDGGRDRGRDYYSEDDRSRSRHRGKKKEKSGIESALEGLGLGGVVAAVTGKKDESRSRSRSRGGRSRSRDGGTKQRAWTQAAQAALLAGAVEAFRARNEPGPWTGAKGQRIATAAIGAGGIDKLIDGNPDKNKKTHIAEAVLGGLAATRLTQGPVHDKSQYRSDSRSRSRSRSVFSRWRSKSRGRGRSSEDEARGTTSHDKFKDIAAGGIVAAVGKQIYDRYRSKSRNRSPSKSGSDDSYRSRRRGRDRDVGADSQGRNGGPDNGAVVGPRGRGGDAEDGEGGGDDNGGGDNAKGQEIRNEMESDVDSESTTDMEQKRKKMRGKEYLTAALASIATIHAGHGVYQSMEASDKRHKAVAAGEMTPEEARKKRSKAWLQDAAAVGIAALGIKGAYSEWKEMNEQRHEIKELEEKKRKREKRRKQRMQGGGQGRNGGGGRGRGPYMSGANGGGRQGQNDGYYGNGNGNGNGYARPYY